MNPHDHEQDDEPVTQRITNAADGSPLRTTAASSVFNWRGAGTGAAADEPRESEPEPAAEPQQSPTTTTITTQEETMAQKRNGAARARKSTRGSPQLAVCQALLAGDLTREALAEACTELRAAQISSALNTAKKEGRVAWIEKDGVYRVTKAGREWVEAAAGESQPATEEAAPKKKRGAGRRKAHTRHARTPKAKEVDTSAADEEAPSPSFRCAVMSDGCFFLTKDGNTIELEPEEHAQMLHYLERMAEGATA